MPKPPTQREMVEQLWYAIIGTNGDGVISELKTISKEFYDFMRNRVDTCPVRQSKMSRSQIITLIVAIGAQIPPWIWILVKALSA